MDRYDDGSIISNPPGAGCGWSQAQGRRDGEGHAPPHNGWTHARKVRFLDSLARHGNVRAACAAVGISAEAAYRLRRRDFAFGEGWRSALVEARAAVEQVLADRAINGVEEHVWYRGELVGSRRRFDTRLLLAHMGRLDRLADEQVAPVRAGRFDELLAVVAGATFPEAMADRDTRYRRATDPLLPIARERYVAEAGQRAACAARADALVALAPEMEGLANDAKDGGDEHAALDAIGAAAGAAGRAAAEADWAAWQARVDAAVALIDGEGATGETAPELSVELPAVELPAEELPPVELPPVEFKSLDPVHCVNRVNRMDRTGETRRAGAARAAAPSGGDGGNRLVARAARLGDAMEPGGGYDVHPLESRRNAPSHPSPLRRLFTLSAPLISIEKAPLAGIRSIRRTRRGVRAGGERSC